MRFHRGFLLLVMLFTLGILAEHTVLPVMEGGDEYLHYNYVQYLLRENHLPERASFLDNSMKQQSGQPPLVYWTAVLLMRLANLTPDDDQALWQRVNDYRNPWYSAPNQWNRLDNRNLFFHEGTQSFETPVIERIDRVIRFTGLIFGLLALMGAYGAAGEIFTDRSWVLVATAVFAFTPQLIHVMSFTNTDSGMIAFTALVTWATLRMLRLGATPGHCLMVGGLLALAGLSKISGLLIVPGVGAALLLDAYKRHRSLRRFMMNGLLVALPLLLFLGPWMLYGYFTFDDPLGTRTHLRPGYYYDTPLNLLEIIPLFREIYLGYWGKLASAVYLHPVTYTMQGTLLVLSGYGLWMILRRFPVRRMDPGDLRTQQTIVLAVIVLCGVLGLIHWMQNIHFITGRLMFQSHTAVAIAITSGLYGLMRRFPKWKCGVQTYAVGIMVAAGVLLTPISIYTAYAPPPMLSHEQVPPLVGKPVNFDQTIRFMGYQQDSPLLEGSHHKLMICWEVLKAASRSAAFSIKLVHDGQIIGDRTSVHGLGRYDSGQWKAGDIFCDRVEVPITGAVENDQTYDILLVMLDAQTQAVDWQATALDGTFIQYPFIGQVVAPAS
ncbi:MAG: glycosyltransferase family 39 protein [Anaerolineae bacterium]|nr:glycosyltransferase family 39 protein [Anaerolineae bacterium]